MHEKPTILCVDDEQMILTNLEDQLTKAFGDDYDIELAESGEEGLEIVEELNENNRPLAVVICDQLMPQMKGEDFLIEVHRQLPQTMKIMLTGQASLESVGRTINEARLFRYVTKPWNKGELVEVVREAAELYQQYLTLVEYASLMRSLNSIVQELNGEQRIDTIIDKFVASAVTNFGAESGYLLLNQPANGDREQDHQKQVSYKFNRDKTLQPIELTRSTRDQITATLSQQNTAAYQLATEMKYKGQEMGYLYLENSFSHERFSQNQRDVLQMLSNQAAIALENANLYQKLEKKNQDITDSILYAKRIQEAVMPDPQELNQVFPHSFVFYKAKDIVSGDFYWWAIQPEQDRAIIAAVDCTGHGVPGAFMSVIGYSFLNQIVNLQQQADPGAILTELHRNVKQAINEEESIDKPEDGMDIALATIDRGNKKLHFSGAHRPLWLIHDAELYTYEGNRHSIGEIQLPEHMGEFHTQTIDLAVGDRIFMFTDGIIDQFGGPEGKRFSKKRLKRLMVEINELSLPEQKERIEQELVNWQGEEELTDDNLLIGIEI
jgi:serine phosphatase RsbU (regulator of sigma subunit)/CheY-like chemotaxis protein